MIIGDYSREHPKISTKPHVYMMFTIFSPIKLYKTSIDSRFSHHFPRFSKSPQVAVSVRCSARASTVAPGPAMAMAAPAQRHGQAGVGCHGCAGRSGCCGPTALWWCHGKCWYNAEIESGIGIPSGNLTVCYGKSLFLMGKSTISMVIFHSKLLVYQRVKVGIYWWKDQLWPQVVTDAWNWMGIGWELDWINWNIRTKKHISGEWVWAMAIT
jgi:hypothetical protein